jgi:hypothetical protein
MLGTYMKLSFPIPTAYRRSLRFALVLQFVAVLLSACVDGSFIAIAVAAWAAFWAGALAVIRRRQIPTGAELVSLRYGPLAIPVIIFAAGQYL